MRPQYSTSSTRRFLVLPSAVRFVATGAAKPTPTGVRRDWVVPFAATSCSLHHCSGATLGKIAIASHRAVGVGMSDHQQAHRRVSGQEFRDLIEAHAKAGRRDKALAQIGLMKAETGAWVPIAVAEGYVGLGDHDQAFVWLNRAADDGWAFLFDVKNRHEFDAIHRDPRYAELLARIRLTP